MTTKSIELSIPALPPRQLNPNFHGKLREHMRAVKEFRQLAYCIANNFNPGGDTYFRKAWLSMEFVIADRRYIRDPDNALAALKPAIDGCISAGILPDDKGTYLVYTFPIKWTVDKQRAPLTILKFKGVRV